MSRDILFKEADFVFSYRIGGVLLHNGCVLLQRDKNGDYAFPGGHAAALEESRDTLVREFWEEARVRIEVGKLMAVGEIFFPWAGRTCHQLALYYRVQLLNKDNAGIPLTGSFSFCDLLDGERFDLEFVWVPLPQLEQLRLYPPQPAAQLQSGDDSVLHFVYHEE